jgi:hypothetical protein
MPERLRSSEGRKITLAQMRSQGIRHVLVYCSNGYCRHEARVNAGRWADDVRLDEIEARLVCTACGSIGAEVRPDWSDRPLRENLTGR